MSDMPITAGSLYVAGDAMPHGSALRTILFRRAAELQRRQDGVTPVSARSTLPYRRLLIAAGLLWQTRVDGA